MPSSTKPDLYSPKRPEPSPSVLNTPVPCPNFSSPCSAALLKPQTLPSRPNTETLVILQTLVPLCCPLNLSANYPQGLSMFIRGPQSLNTCLSPKVLQVHKPSLWHRQHGKQAAAAQHKQFRISLVLPCPTCPFSPHFRLCRDSAALLSLMAVPAGKMAVYMVRRSLLNKL